MPPNNKKNASKETSSKKENSKQTKEKQVEIEEKVVIKEVISENEESNSKNSDFDSASASDSASDSDSVSASDDVESDNDDIKITNISKEKKLKKTWQEVAVEWEKVSLELKENEAKHKELQEALHKNEKNRNELERQRNRLYSVLSKSHDDEIKRVVKLKPKRKGNKKGGFNKETPVPLKLIKYLGLEEGTEMSRPKVMSLLNNKFKTVGLKNGQITTLDKNTAKSLEKEENREIKFTEFQSFIKEFYDEAFKPSK